MRSLFNKFKEGLKRQTPTLYKAFGEVFSGAKLDRDALEQLEEALYTADFGVNTVEEIIDEIQVAYKADKQILEGLSISSEHNATSHEQNSPSSPNSPNTSKLMNKKKPTSSTLL